MTDAQTWLTEFQALLLRARNTRCPDCGATAPEPIAEGQAGVMLTCPCGARSSVTSWAEGSVDLRRNPNGTYSPVKQERA